MKYLLNPAVLYGTLWVCLIVLYSLRLSNVLLPMGDKALLFFFCSICCFLGGWVIWGLMQKKIVAQPRVQLEVYKEWLFNKNTRVTFRIIFALLVVGSMVEFALFQNFPLFAAVGIGAQIHYTEYGLPGIHGLFNALFLVSCSIVFARQIIRPRRGGWAIFFLLSLWPVILLTRQLFISLIVQSALIYLLLTPVNIRSIIKISLCSLGVIVAFGYLGDLRSGRDCFIALARPTFEYPDFMPSGFLWVYIYLTSPINNIINNIDIEPSYVPFGIISGFFPSFVRGWFATSVAIETPQWNLVNEALNVSSIHGKTIPDLGLYLSNILYVSISFVFSYILYRSSNSPRHGFTLIVILHGIVLSFFVDFIFHLVFVAQSAIYLVVFRRWRLESA